MRNDFYVGIYEDTYLAHGTERSNHKYAYKKFINGKWRYYYDKAGAAGRRAWGLVKKYGPTAVDLLTGRPSILNQTKKIYDNRDAYKEIYDDINKKRKVKQAKRKAKNKQRVSRNY